MSANITLTASLLDQGGVAIPNSQLIITLCGFGYTLPRIAGTGMLAKVGPVEYTTTNGQFSIALFGNDQITPPGTFYTIVVLDDKKNAVQAGMYQFSGGPQTIVLSSATQLAPTYPGT